MFKFELHQDSKPWQIDFSGDLNELAQMSLLDLCDQKQIRLNLEKLASMNSIGIKCWANWVHGLPTETEYIFSKCSVPFVRCLATVREILPKKRTLESFFVPFVNADTLEVAHIEFKDGVHFNSHELIIPARVSSETTGHELELDVVPKKYFSFLKDFYPNIRI